MDDISNDICLPSIITPTSSPSRIIEKVLEKLKSSQSKMISAFIDKKNECSLNINKNIEDISEEIKKKLEESKKNIEDVLFEATEKINYDNIPKIRSGYFECLHQRIVLNNEQRTAMLNNFHGELVALEKERTKELSYILKSTYDELKQLAFRVPRETEIYIEKHIEDINQITLNNHRHYAELKRKLLFQVNNDFKAFMHDLRSLKQMWAKCLKSQTTKAIQNVRSDLKEISSTFELKSEREKMKETCNEMENEISNLTVIMSFKDADKWLKWIQMKMAVLDKSAQKIMSSFKQVAIAIFNRFFEEMRSIHDQIMEIAVDNNQIDQVQSEMYTPTLQEIQDQYNAELETLQTMWTEHILEMEKIVNNNQQFLLAGATLWENHFHRAEIIKTLVNIDVENCISNNNIIAENSNGKLNILIDTLRQESSREKMDKCLESIRKMLNSMEDVYKSQFTQECNVIKKYKQYLDSEIDVLIAEIKRFLEAYPPDFNKDPKIQRRRASQTSEKEDPEEGLIPNQMMYCKFQVDAISNWQFGVWEAIHQYVNVAKQELLSDADEWIKHRTIVIEKRLELRLFFHRLRFLRIRGNIYTQRLDELCCHDRRLEEHKIAIDTSLKCLRDEVFNSENGFNIILEKYLLNIQNVESKIKYFQSSSIANANFRILKAMLARAAENIGEIYSENVRKVENFMTKVKVSNIKYVQAMKLFTDGGNFSIPETKTYAKHLNKLQINCEKSTANILKEIGVIRQKFEDALQKRNTEIVATIKIVKGELEFMENNSSNLKKLENDIKFQVCSAKKIYDDLKDKFENDLVYKTTDNCGSYEFLQSFNQEYEDFIDKIKKHVEFLLHPEPLILYSDQVSLSLPVRENNDVPKLDETSTQQRKSEFKHGIQHVVVRNKKEDSSTLDYTTNLFNFNLDENDDNYMGNMLRLIWKYWNMMFNKGKEFYKEHVQCCLLDKNKISPNMDTFFMELSNNFLYYLNQCEIRWIEDVHDFVALFVNVSQFFSEYFDIYTTVYCMSDLRKFEDQYREIIRDIEHEKGKIRNLYRDLQKKLMPLHGHPNNKKLLADLQITQKETENVVQERITDFLQPYVERYSNYFKASLERSQLLERQLPDFVLTKDTMTDLQTTLEKQLSEKSTIFKDYVKKLNENSETPLQKEMLKNCLSLLKHISQESQSLMLKSWQNVISSTTADITTTEIETEAGYEIELRENFARYLKNIQGQDMAKFHDTLKQEWECAVKAVSDLYTVRYDQ